MRGLICARCGRAIPKNQQMVEKIFGRYVTTHRDCIKPYDTARSLDSMLKNANRDSEEKQKIIKKRRGYR